MRGQIDDGSRGLRALTAALAALVLAAVVLAVPAGARATDARNSTTSANWAGYAAHGENAHFQRASGIWRIPKLACRRGRRSYSAVWVGIGGYSLSATALEQTGTETDCRPDGSTVTAAWFEVVPAPSRNVKLDVRPGDLVAAAVTVSGHDVTLTLRDLTTHSHFTKSVVVSDADTSSAEWIVEAPSNCSRSGLSCQTLPLADFGTLRFTHATVQTRQGRTGAIAGSRWNTTAILLRTRGDARPAAASARAQAAPSALGAADEAFSVVYSPLTAAAASSVRSPSSTASPPTSPAPGIATPTRVLRWM
jgi:hypothetical protein